MFEIKRSCHEVTEEIKTNKKIKKLTFFTSPLARVTSKKTDFKKITQRNIHTPHPCGELP